MNSKLIARCSSGLIRRASSPIARFSCAFIRQALRTAGASFAVLLLGSSLSRAAEFFVPSFDTPTLQDAINDAAGNVDPENSILIGTPMITESVTIGGEFDSTHRLTIGPDGGAGLVRATIRAAAFNTPVVSMTGVIGSDQGYITLQDLDLLRHGSGSASHLVRVFGMSHVTIERCRIGLNWTTPGPNGFSNLRIDYPIEVIVRNCILFSLFPGNFDYGIDVVSMLDPASSILLYNNLAADYRLAGIHINDGAAPASSVVLLRNNIAVNHLGVSPEPVGYHSEVDDAVIVSSHNVVFCTPGQEETVAAGASSIGNGPASGISMLRTSAMLSFATTTWTLGPPWNANPNFFRLNPVGLLHDAATDYGQTVSEDGVPDAADVANLLDIERQGRPGGTPPHTDRGPDQSDFALALGVEDVAVGGADGSVLRAAAERNPSRDLAIEYASERAGTLTLELFDVSGRRIAQESRAVGAGEHSAWRPNAAMRTGLVFYRAVLRGQDGSVHEAMGKVVAVR